MPADLTGFMTLERWRKLAPLIDDALERTGIAREQFLTSLESDVRKEVEAIVTASAQPLAPFEEPAAMQFAALILEPAPPPSVLGDRYEIERLLGQGGMACVYLARDRRHSRHVAVKVLSPDVSAFVTRERFLTEIRIAAHLTHPHIVGVHDSGETDGHLFYVMPHVDGESLRDRLDRRGRLPIEDALAIAREIADALAYAHARGVIHRDIKPANVLLESGHAVVTDFGIARAIDAATGGDATPRVATGTPAYMSPEQATAGADVDGRSDVYSLGCVLFEMLAGQAPFTGPNAQSVLEQHRSASPPSISATRPEVPAEMAAASSRALAKRPSDRFESAVAFAEAIVGSQASGAETATALGVPRRNSVRSLALIGIGALVVAAAAAPLMRLSSYQRARSATTTATSTNPRAQAAYRNGVYFLARRTATDRARSIDAFETAIRLDPRFAAAYAGLADAYANSGYFGYPGALGGAQAFQRAEAALATALILDQSLAETQLSLAKLRWMQSPDLLAAERAVHRALAANPKMAEAHFEHARLLALRLLADSAVSEVTAARQYDLTSSVRPADVAWVYWIVRRYDDAATEARAAIGLDSTSSTAYLALGGALVGQGKYSEAIGALETGFALSRGNRLFLPQLGHAYARAGRRGDATRVLNELEKLYDSGLVSPYYVAQVHLGLDQPDSALTWLDKAQAEHVGHLVFLRANAVWDPLRSNPRFRSIERSVGLE